MLLLILLEVVRCLLENIYTVNCTWWSFWKELCETHLDVTQFVKLGMLLGYCVPFLVVLYIILYACRFFPQNVRCVSCIYV